MGEAGARPTGYWDWRRINRRARGSRAGKAGVGAVTTFREAARLLAELAGMEVGSETLRTQAERIGTELEGQQRAVMACAEQTHEPPVEDHDPAQATLVAELTGRWCAVATWTASSVTATGTKSKLAWRAGSSRASGATELRGCAQHLRAGGCRVVLESQPWPRTAHRSGGSPGSTRRGAMASEGSRLRPFVSLAHGIEADRAVVNGLALPWSTGPVEGTVTRVKL